MWGRLSNVFCHGNLLQCIVRDYNGVCVSAYALAGTDVPIKDKDDKEAQDKLFRHFVVWAIVLGAFFAKIFLRW